jgi:hypothetical protein
MTGEWWGTFEGRTRGTGGIFAVVAKTGGPPGRFVAVVAFGFGVVVSVFAGHFWWWGSEVR